MGPRVVSLSLQGLEWSGRPFAEVQTRRARAARPSIVAGANGGLSETKGFQAEGQVGMRGDLSAAALWRPASDEGEAFLRQFGWNPCSSGVKLDRAVLHKNEFILEFE